MGYSELYRPYYETTRLEHPYQHMVQIKIPSLSPLYQADLRLPDLLLSIFHHIDPKTGYLVKDVRLQFQPDGPCEAELNFKHDSVSDKYAFRVYNFDSVSMDATFGQGITEKVGGHFTSNLGVEKGVKGGVEAGVESSIEKPGIRTYRHAVFGGMLIVDKTGKNTANLEAWGQLV